MKIRELLINYFLLKSPRKYPELDGLRGVAVLMVLGVHFFGAYQDKLYFTNTNSFFYYIFRGFHSGHIGVDIFFIISGFLIARSLAEEKNLDTFLEKRFYRLLPAHAAVLILMYTLQSNYSFRTAIFLTIVFSTLYYLVQIPRFFFRPLPYVYLALVCIFSLDIANAKDFHLLINFFSLDFIAKKPMINYVTWSLCYEYVFYFSFFASSLLYFKMNKILGKAIGLVFTFILLFSFDDFRFAGFILGIGLFNLLRSKEANRFFSKFYLSEFGFLVFFSLPFLWHNFIEKQLVPVFYIFASISGSLLIFGILNKRKYAQIFNNTMLRIIGTVSYSFYLVHAVIVQYMTGSYYHVNSKATMLIGFILTYLITFMTSTLFYGVFERPLLVRNSNN